MVHGMRELIEEAEATNTPLLVIAMDVKNAHNEWSRQKAQEAIIKATETYPALRSLAVANEVFSIVDPKIYCRNSTGFQPYHLTDSAAVGECRASRSSPSPSQYPSTHHSRRHR